MAIKLPFNAYFLLLIETSGSRDGALLLCPLMIAGPWFFAGNPFDDDMCWESFVMLLFDTASLLLMLMIFVFLIWAGFLAACTSILFP